LLLCGRQSCIFTAPESAFKQSSAIPGNES
jgi:hypothetical protein